MWPYDNTSDGILNCSPVLQYIPRNMHTVFALLCFVVVIHWLIFPYPSGLLHWHCGNLTIAPVPAKQPWWIWINTSCEFIMNDCITTTKQSTTKPCAYFLGYTVVCQWQAGCGLMLQLSIAARGDNYWEQHHLGVKCKWCHLHFVRERIVASYWCGVSLCCIIVVCLYGKSYQI